MEQVNTVKIKLYKCSVVIDSWLSIHHYKLVTQHPAIDQPLRWNEECHYNHWHWHWFRTSCSNYMNLQINFIMKYKNCQDTSYTSSIYIYIYMQLTRLDNGAAKNSIVVKQHRNPTRSIASLVFVEIVAGSDCLGSEGVTATASTIFSCLSTADCTGFIDFWCTLASVMYTIQIMTAIAITTYCMTRF